MKKRVFIIGLDGATFDVLKPLMDNGSAPNMAAVAREGACGPLRSTVPAFSPVAWTSLITGVNPGKHGVVDAFIHHEDAYRITFVNSTYRKTKPLWTMLNEQGKKCGVLNVPLTYPPEKLDGFMITGMLTPETAEDFIYPPELASEIKKIAGKYIFEAVQSADKPDMVVKETYTAIAQREVIADYLLDNNDPDLFFMVFVETDRIQHQFWKYTDEGNTTVTREQREKYGSVIRDVYSRLDQAVGRITARMGENDTLFIVSDHGFGPLRRAFALGNWLAEKGYTSHVGGRAPTASKMKMGILDKIKRRLFGKPEDRDKALNAYFPTVDWSRTTAYTEGASGGIIINLAGRQKDGAVRHEDYESVRSRIIEELFALKDPATGLKVVENVHRREEIYSGGDFTGTPDLFVICNSPYHTISPSECAYYHVMGNELFLDHAWSGRHEDYGVLFMKGPGVRKGYNIKGAHIMDVAPTALYAMDAELSSEFDGRPLLEAMEDEALESRPPRYSSSRYIRMDGGGNKEFSEEEALQIEERLRNLGYM